MKPVEYDRMFREEDVYWWFVGRRRLATVLLENSLPARNLRILDVGCGTGAMSRELMRFGSVVSTDLSALAIGYGRQRQLTGLCCADATALPFADASFDAVVALDLLEHIADDLLAVREFARVLAPGGHLVATVPAYQFLWSGHDLALMHHRRYTRRSFGDLLASGGLSTVRLTYAMTALFPIVWLVRRRSKKPGSEEATIQPVPRWLNKVLIRVLDMENAYLRRADLPYGVSVAAVARRVR